MKRLLVALTMSFGVTTAAHADNWGCEVLLCLAAPRGPMSIKECVPPIKKLWRHLAKGRGFPVCSMGSASSSNYGKNEWASGDYCPPQFQYYVELDRGPELRCSMSGVVTVVMKGETVNRYWWRGDGETFAEYATTQVPGSEIGTGVDRGVVVREIRLTTCAEAAADPKYANHINRPDYAGMSVPDGWAMYGIGKILAVAHGGYADRPVYDGRTLLGYGFARESRSVKKNSQGEVMQVLSDWSATSTNNCDLLNPDSFTDPNVFANSSDGN